MKIVGSEVRLAAQHEQVEVNQRRESLTAWRDTPQGRVETRQENSGLQLGVSSTRAQLQGVNLRISDAARALQPLRVEVPEEEIPELAPYDDLQMAVLKALIERLTGQEFKLFDPRELQGGGGGGGPQGAEGGGRPREGWGMVYDYYESHFESEQLDFSAQGVVKTADGREIAFTVDLSMSRQFASEQHINLRAGDALKDPLVVNFAGTAAQLTSDKLSFDIDSDGRKDQIAFVAPGSGFLALDRNGDGKVNDGSELFGPSTGQGFAELAQYDGDGNNWIDEADAIYSQLRIWSREEGKEKLFALGEKGVGAIYLGNITTPFALKDANNALQGQVRSGSIFVGEQGNVGTVQQVDLVV